MKTMNSTHKPTKKINKIRIEKKNNNNNKNPTITYTPPHLPDKVWYSTAIKTP